MDSAAPKTRPGKRDSILNAMLDVVVERGFHEAPMSLIAERAGASTGVIYHHFSSKDEIIRALYTRLEDLKTCSLLAGYTPEMETRQAFVHVWLNVYDFYRQHLREMRFLEQYESAGFTSKKEAPIPGSVEAEFARRFSPRSEGGVLQDWPREVLMELTFGTVGRLASQPQRLDPEIVREIGERVWETVRAVK